VRTQYAGSLGCEVTVAGKLLVILAFVAAAPLGISTVTALGTYEGELDSNLDELHRRTAGYGARATGSTLDTAQRTIGGLARTIPWSGLSDEERHGGLLLIYEQLDDVAIVSLLDANGEGVGRAVHALPGTTTTHPTTSLDTLAAFGPMLPPASRGRGWTVGDPFHPPGQRAPLVPMTFPIVGSDGSTWTLAIGLSLRGACDELAATSPAGVTTRLVDTRGTTLCGSAAVADAFTAAAPLAQGWRVIAEQPRDLAYASLRRIRRQNFFWVGVAVLGAIAAGLILTQAIRRPLRKLTAGAEALARGDLSHRVAMPTMDELGALGNSFDKMADELEKKDSEIRTWNEDLQRKVDARTAELKAAQDQLLQSKKLGAMAALGAGIAHEINNPLAGVLGMTQVLLARAKASDQLDERTVRSLTTIEREALRVRDIVERMSALAQESVRDGTRVDLATVVDSVAATRADRFASAHVQVERVFASGVPRVIGNAAQLEHAISQLVDNSIKAMSPAGGRLRLAIRSIEGELVAIDIEDTGRGIPPDLIDKIFEPFFTTKDDWRGVGLGLALAHRIVEVHQGRIRASSTVGTGTTMTVTLPAARQGAHLT